jgi:hypothetical protein
MSAMTIDNLFWISASPEYNAFKRYSFIDKIKYVVFKRIITVWTNWRDIIPAIIMGGIFSLL